MRRRLSRLSPQQQRVLTMIGRGYPTTEIAEKLGVGRATAAVYVTQAIAFVKSRGRLEEGQPAKLTPREREVEDLMRQGLTDSHIARRLNIGVRTAETHAGRVMRKRNVNRRRDLPGSDGDQ